MKNRFNVTLSNGCIEELESIADVLQTSRSGAIEYLARRNKDARLSSANASQDLKRVKAFVDELCAEIEKEEVFGRRQAMKQDAFYQLVGYINSISAN